MDWNYVEKKTLKFFELNFFTNSRICFAKYGGLSVHLLILGETGLGKSTLMDSLFNTNFESTPSPHSLPIVKLKAHTYELQESNVRLKVRINLNILLFKYLKVRIILYYLIEYTGLVLDVMRFFFKIRLLGM